MRFLSQGSIWQLSSEDPVRESEDTADSVEDRISTEPESRRAEVFEGEVEKDVEVEGQDDENRLEEW
jgi:hypothetical protein